jgi:hypothetical protein
MACMFSGVKMVEIGHLFENRRDTVGFDMGGNKV